MDEYDLAAIELMKEGCIWDNASHIQRSPSGFRLIQYRSNNPNLWVRWSRYRKLFLKAKLAGLITNQDLQKNVDCFFPEIKSFV